MKSMEHIEDAENFENMFPERWVTSEGKLDEKQITERQILYQGLNGRHVERFTVQSGQTYIFKPLTNSAQHGRERWMYEHVMAQLPPIYPQLIAASDQAAAPSQSWMIYEDMGQLEHHLHESTLLNVATHMAAACAACRGVARTAASRA